MTAYLAIIMFLGWLMSYTEMVRFKKTYILIVIFSLSLLGMLYNPVRGFLEYGFYTDLYRIFNELDLFRTYGWNADKIVSDTTRITTNYGPVILSKVYMFLCARLTSNDHILVLINSVLTYGTIAMGLLIVGKKIDASNSEIVSSFIVFVLVNDYTRIIANIRMPLAMSLFLLIWCKQISSEKNGLWYYFAYFLTCLIHSAMIIFFIIKIIVDFIPKKFMKLCVVLMLISSLFVNSTINLLNHFSSVGNAISGLLQKALLYSEDSSKVGIMGLENNFTATISNILKVILFIILLYIIKQAISKNAVKVNSQILKIVSFGKLVTAFAIGSVWSFHLFNRTVLFMMAIAPIYILIISKKYNMKALSLNEVSLFSLVSWSLVIVNIVVFFLGYTYNQLVF